MAAQAAEESGEAPPPAGSPAAPPKVLGADLVPDDAARELCRGVLSSLRTLMAERDMTVQEVRLILLIEDPRARERRRQLGVEEASGVSRDEVARALTSVVAGEVPNDRVALKVLHDEMVRWPFLGRVGE